MNNQQILEKAINLAIDAGWNEPGVMNPKFRHYDEDLKLIEWQHDINNEYSMPLNEVIFSHEFAKALWGEREPIAWQDGEAIGIDLGLPSGWRYHLQQMVIADNPIEYLGEHLDDRSTA